MDLVTMLMLLLAGCAAGFLGGFFGVGGGVIFVPALLVAYKSAGVSSLVATHLAFGTSLLAIVFTAAASAYRYDRSGFVVWKAAIIMGLGSVAGAAAGSLLAGNIPEESLKRIFGALVFMAAVQLFMRRRKPKDREQPSLYTARLGAAGVAVGFVSSLAGVGGGILAIPILYAVFHVPLKKAFGTSTAVIVLTGIAAATGYALIGLHEPLLPGGTLGFVDPLYALPLVVGSVPLAFVGASISERADPPLLRKLFGVFLIVLAVKMLIAP